MKLFRRERVSKRDYVDDISPVCKVTPLIVPVVLLPARASASSASSPSRGEKYLQTGSPYSSSSSTPGRGPLESRPEFCPRSLTPKCGYSIHRGGKFGRGHAFSRGRRGGQEEEEEEGLKPWDAFVGEREEEEERVLR